MGAVPVMWVRALASSTRRCVGTGRAMTPALCPAGGSGQTGRRAGAVVRLCRLASGDGRGRAHKISGAQIKRYRRRLRRRQIDAAYGYLNTMGLVMPGIAVLHRISPAIPGQPDFLRTIRCAQDKAHSIDQTRAHHARGHCAAAKKRQQQQRARYEADQIHALFPGPVYDVVDFGLRRLQSAGHTAKTGLPFASTVRRAAVQSTNRRIP